MPRNRDVAVADCIEAADGVSHLRVREVSGQDVSDVHPWRRDIRVSQPEVAGVGGHDDRLARAVVDQTEVDLAEHSEVDADLGLVGMQKAADELDLVDAVDEVYVDIPGPDCAQSGKGVLDLGLGAGAAGAHDRDRAGAQRPGRLALEAQLEDPVRGVDDQLLLLVVGGVAVLRGGHDRARAGDDLRRGAEAEPRVEREVELQIAGVDVVGGLQCTGREADGDRDAVEHAVDALEVKVVDVDPAVAVGVWLQRVATLEQRVEDLVLEGGRVVDRVADGQ